MRSRERIFPVNLALPAYLTARFAALKLQRLIEGLLGWVLIALHYAGEWTCKSHLQRNEPQNIHI
jgi:hypothetical protein